MTRAASRARRRALLTGLCSTIAAVGYASPARAGCTITSSGSVTLAPSTSYDVRGGTVPQVSGSAGLSCTGTTLSVLGGSYARATVTSANGFRLLAPAGEAIGYAASADPAGTQAFSPNGGTVDYMSTNLVSLLGIGSASGFSAPLYVRLAGSPNVPAGTYRDVLTVVWDYYICNGVQVAGVCVAYERGRMTTTVDVAVAIGTDCRIAAPNLSFGAAPLASQFTPVTQSVLVDCTKGTSYKVAFSSGRGGSARPWRTMRDGAGRGLQYNIYRPDGITVWDETNPSAAAAPGTGDPTPGQIQTYVARINPAQPTPAAGSYSDQLTVVISF